MRRLGISWLLVAFAVAGQVGRGAENGEPDFKEVYDLIRAHLSGTTDSELNRAAVRGLISALGPRVSLVDKSGSISSASEAQAPTSSLLEGDIAFLRTKKIDDALPKAVTEACEKLATTNKVKGLILDLRYARGDDYAAAVAVAELFLKKEKPLLNWGNGLVHSKEKSTALSLPAAVLVNRETSGAAEALAAVMREAGVGLIIGGRTAGQAMVGQDFPLKNGERLRIATEPVKLGDGSTLSTQGVKPDIAVDITPEQERAFYADAFHLPARGALSATNRPPRRPRFNEAELVRERREVQTNTEITASREVEPEKPAVSDPALARAIDLLKGLAVVRQSRS